MTLVDIPSIEEIGVGLSLVADGACEMASSAVQSFVTNPSIAQTGLGVLAGQIEVLEQLVEKLREVAAGIEQVHDKLAVTQLMEWHSPAGTAFRQAAQLRQEHAKRLQQTTTETALLAHQGIDELRIMVSSLQSLLATARAAVGATVGTTLGQVCS